MNIIVYHYNCQNKATKFPFIETRIQENAVLPKSAIPQYSAPSTSRWRSLKYFIIIVIFSPLRLLAHFLSTNNVYLIKHNVQFFTKKHLYVFNFPKCKILLSIWQFFCCSYQNLVIKLNYRTIFEASFLIMFYQKICILKLHSSRNYTILWSLKVNNYFSFF